MKLEAGSIVALRVDREVSPYGYFLAGGPKDVLLHYSEVEGGIRIGDTVEAFLYHDSEDRLAATMKRPLLLPGQVGLLEVVDVHPRLGCFLEIGLGRNLLLPQSELPELPEARPIVGDKVFVTLTHDKQGRLLAELAGEKELVPLCFHAPSSWKNEWVEARVYNLLNVGAFVICEGGVLGFGAIGMIHASESTKPLRVGQTVRARVTFVRDDGRVNLSLKEAKEIGRNQDAERLLTFLKERPNGAMPYSDETPADLIWQKFGISKAAFKRAIGKLMKEGLVYQKESWTYLQQTEQSDANSDGQ